MVSYHLRMTGSQHRSLRSHLFPGDGNEAVALLLCGRRIGKQRHVLTVRTVVPIPHESCMTRTPDQVSWPTHLVDGLVAEAFNKKQAIVKVHSHPYGYPRFSDIDDHSDRHLIGSICSLLGDGLAHASLIMRPDGDMFGRMVGDGYIGDDLSSIVVAGDDLLVWHSGYLSPTSTTPEFCRRHAQAFGRGTIEQLRRMSIAVVGCSGTGSIVVELLARLGVGRMILIDPDVVEEKNLNRILNSGKEDAYLCRPKVHVLASAIARMGFGQDVIALHANLACREAIEAVGECDVVFGCMDGVEGRHLLNRTATFYNVPYFDVGVRLDSDGHGGINNIAGAVHYLQPGRSSLLSREVYFMDQVEAEELRRINPGLYEQQRGEGYIRGVAEDRPAVISVNMFYASLAVNEFLCRLHPYRNQSNTEYAEVGASLAEMALHASPDVVNCPVLQRHVGRGDVSPLLERPMLS